MSKRLDELAREWTKKYLFGAARVGPPPETGYCETAFKQGYAAAVKDAQPVFDKLLEADREWWFQPGPEYGVCSTCDGGQDPNYKDNHEPRCLLYIIHEATSDWKKLQE